MRVPIAPHILYRADRIVVQRRPNDDIEASLLASSILTGSKSSIIDPWLSGVDNPGRIGASWITVCSETGPWLDP